MQFITILFLGRSLSGILQDARNLLGEQVGEIIVVTREGDTMPLPEGLETTVVSSSEFREILRNLHNKIVNLIANGGSTQQLLSVFDLLRGRDTCRVLDIQRDGGMQLGPDGTWLPAEVSFRRVQFEHWTCGAIDRIVPVTGGKVRVTEDFGEPSEGSNVQTVVVSAEPGEYKDEDLYMRVTVSLVA